MATAFSPPPTTHPCYRLQGWLLGVSVALPYAGGLCPKGRLSCYAYRLHIYTHHSPGFRIHFSWCGLGAGSLAQQHNEFLDFTPGPLNLGGLPAPHHIYPDPLGQSGLPVAPSMSPLAISFGGFVAAHGSAVVVF